MTRLLGPEKEALLIEDYVAGASLESVASRHGCAFTTVRNVLIRNNIPRRSVGRSPRPVAATKTCSSCGHDLPRSEFYGDGQRTSECRACAKAKWADKYHADGAVRQRKLDVALTANGWTREQFDAAWEAQGGRCGVCRIEMSKGGKSANAAHADHDHATGGRRELLCSNCNRGLGCFKDSPEALASAIEYLRRHSSV